MIKTFTHKFKNDFLLKLTVDLAGNPPHMVADKKIDDIVSKNEEFKDEYLKWVNEVVFPGIWESLSDEQKKYLEEKGK